MPEAHSGQHAVAVARAHGVEVMFTLSGAHVFPMYDGAVTADPQMRIVDVRHEQTAAFAAEAMGKLTRSPGLAVLTAGPGVTNGVSAIAQAQFSGSPLVVVGGRAPANRWGSGSAAGARPAPDPRAGVQARPHHPHGCRGARRDARGLQPGSGPPSWPGVRGRADGRVLQHDRRRDAGRGAAAAHGARRRRHQRDRRAPGAVTAARARARHRRVGRRRRGRCPAPRGGGGPPGDHQRDGPRSDPRRTPAARDQGAWRRARGRRPRRRGGHAAGLPAGVRRLRREGGGDSGARRTPRGLGHPGLPARRPRRRCLR